MFFIAQNRFKSNGTEEYVLTSAHYYIYKGGYIMDVFEIVKGKIASFSELDLSLISKDTSLTEDLVLDSFSLMCLIGELSEEYNIKIDAEDIISFASVGDIVSYIEAK